MPTLSDMIHEAADRMTIRHVSVHAVSIRGHVTISAPDKEDIFLQGDDGVSFLLEARSNWNTAMDVTMNECWLHQAEPYVDNLWSKT